MKNFSTIERRVNEFNANPAACPKTTKYKNATWSLLFDGIDPEYFEVDTKKQAFAKLKEEIEGCLGHITGNPSRKCENYLQGLGSGMNLPLYNHDILIWAEKSGLISKNATEKQEDKFLGNYWNACAFALSQILETVKKEG